MRRNASTEEASCSQFATFATVAVAQRARLPSQPPTRPQANRLCGLLGIEKPVIQASKSGLTSPELCAAASNDGGLGGIAAVDAETIEVVKALTEKPFGVTPYFFDDDTFATLKDEGVIIIFLLGMGSKEADCEVDVDTIKYLKGSGFIVMFRDVNTTVPVLLAAEEAGADVLIASGYGQEGNGPETRITLSSMPAEARSQVKGILVGSGYIVDTATAAAVAALGAEGAYVRTRFNACEESPCSPEARRVIVDMRTEDLVEWRGVLGFVRANRTPLAEQCVEMSDAGATRQELIDIYQMMWVAGMASGDVENWAVGMNDSVNSITSISKLICRHSGPCTRRCAAFHRRSGR